MGGGEAHDCLNIADLIAGRDADGLDEELVATFGVERWLFYHLLEQYFGCCQLIS